MKTTDHPTNKRTVVRRGKDWADEDVLCSPGRRRIGLRGRGEILIHRAELIANGWFRLYPGSGSPRYIDVRASAIIYAEPAG